MAHEVKFHTCNAIGGYVTGLPHEPEETITVRTLSEAVRATPYGRTSYINWSNRRRRWMVDSMGTLCDYRHRERSK